MKKLLSVIIFITLFIGIWQTCLAVELLIEYPEIPGAQSPNETSDLPNLINYIYKFALLACGIVAFISILFGAIQYVTSAGNASKAGDAKDRITQALWGILILLAAVVILRTINPDLVNLSLTLP
jgi:choline-glycine betaine transporter